MGMKAMKIIIHLRMKNIRMRTQKKMKKLTMNIQKHLLQKIMFIWNEKEFEDNIHLPGNTRTGP